MFSIFSRKAKTTRAKGFNEMMVLDLSRMVSNHRRHSHVEAREIAEKMTHSLNKMGVKMYKSGTRWNLREDDFRTAYANATY